MRRIVQDCRQQGFTPTSILDSSDIDETILSDPKGDGRITVLNNFPYLVDSTAATKATYAAYARYSPGLTDSQYLGQITVSSRSACQLFEAAAKAAKLSGNPATANLLDRLNALHDETLGGAAAPLTFHKNAPNSVNCRFLAVQKGR